MKCTQLWRVKLVKSALSSDKCNGEFCCMCRANHVFLELAGVAILGAIQLRHITKF